MKILICEDEEILLTALEFRMRKVGMDVVLAKDGQEAYEKIALEKPDLIVADIEMPKLSGIQLIEQVRNSPFKHLPIIVISALEHEDDILKAYEKGANDFVAKPFKPAELVLRIKRILR